MQAVWVRVLDRVPRRVPHTPAVSAAALCHGSDDAGGGAVYKAGRGAVHDNPSGRFKHKTIRFDGPPMLVSEGSPLVFATAHSDAADSAAFGLSVRSSSAEKFEVNAVRLDRKVCVCVRVCACVSVCVCVCVCVFI